MISLALRLFGNIFAGALLIGLMIWLTGQLAVAHVPIGNIWTSPFWLFEMFVACVQTLVFCTLSALYFKEAIEAHH